MGITWIIIKFKVKKNKVQLEKDENLDLELQEFNIVDDLIKHWSLVCLSFHKTSSVHNS
jgi:hypothetical protein